MSIEQKVAAALRDKKKKLAVAESCTGGLVTHRLTNIPGSSSFLKCGIIAYSNDAKIQLLKVPSLTLKRYGAVSEQTAIAMAKGVRKRQKTDLGVALTGIAGPDGGTKKKPVGLTYIAVNTPLETVCLKFLFQGPRAGIKSRAATQALKLLREFLA